MKILDLQETHHRCVHETALGVQQVLESCAVCRKCTIGVHIWDPGKGPREVLGDCGFIGNVPWGRNYDTPRQGPHEGLFLWFFPGSISGVTRASRKRHARLSEAPGGGRDTDDPKNARL